MTRASKGHSSKATKVSARIDGPIFLTGFMGTGKTQIGRVLAIRMRRVFIDTDSLIEDSVGKAISDIFAEEGEERFRQIEQECVSKATSRTNAVIALGGGAIANEKNLKMISRAGVVVTLEASIETILNRVGRRDNRPLLAGLNRDQKHTRISELLKARAPFYSRADIRMKTLDKDTPEATVGKLIRQMERWCEDR